MLAVRDHKVRYISTIVDRISGHLHSKGYHFFIFLERVHNTCGRTPKPAVFRHTDDTGGAQMDSRGIPNFNCDSSLNLCIISPACYEKSKNLHKMYGLDLSILVIYFSQSLRNLCCNEMGDIFQCIKFGGNMPTGPSTHTSHFRYLLA